MLLLQREAFEQTRSNLDQATEQERRQRELNANLPSVAVHTQPQLVNRCNEGCKEAGQDDKKVSGK
jgi:hypothetical protein